MINKILKFLYNKKEKYVVGTDVIEAPTEITAESVKKLVNEQVVVNTNNSLSEILTKIQQEAKRGSTRIVIGVTNYNEQSKTLTLSSTYVDSLNVYYNILQHELEKRGFIVEVDKHMFVVKW